MVLVRKIWYRLLLPWLHYWTSGNLGIFSVHLVFSQHFDICSGILVFHYFQSSSKTNDGKKNRMMLLFFLLIMRPVIAIFSSITAFNNSRIVIFFSRLINSFALLFLHYLLSPRTLINIKILRWNIVQRSS